MNGDKIDSRLAVMETTVNFIKDELKDIKINHLKHIYEKIECIIKKMSNPRLPLWATFLITALFSLVTGLIVAFFKNWG